MYLFTSPTSIDYIFRGNIDKNASKGSLLKLHSKGYRGQRAGALGRDGLLLQQGAGQDHQWQRSRGQVASSAEYTGGETNHYCKACVTEDGSKENAILRLCQC